MMVRAAPFAEFFDDDAREDFFFAAMDPPLGCTGFLYRDYAVLSITMRKRYFEYSFIACTDTFSSGW
jgi:hypothetical protein